MKRICISLIVLSFLTGALLAAPGDFVSDKYRSVWQITASGLTTLLAKMNSLPGAYQATQSMSEWEAWIRLEYAQPGSLAKIFPSEVYSFLLDRFIGYNYGNTEIHPSYKPPVCSVDGSSIECAADTIAAHASRSGSLS